MNAFLNPKPLIRFAASTLIVSAITSMMPLRAIAQASYNPPDVGLPGRTEGGGTRGSCAAVGDKSLTAIAPNQNFGYTTDEYPTFYWYVPEIGAEAAEFVLLDEDNTEVYVTTFQIQDSAGIISLSLPGEAGIPPLTPGENYQWFFSLVCDFNDRSGNIFTSGWIQRTEESAFPSLENRLEAAPEEEHAEIYAQEGIWYSALNRLAERYFSDPSNADTAQQWQTLLESIGRENLAAEPFVLHIDGDAERSDEAEAASELTL